MKKLQIKQRKRNKGFLILWILFIVLAVLDMVTTLLNRQLLPYIEANPLYRLAQTLIPIILINIVCVWFFWWSYRRVKAGVFFRFFIIVMLVCVIPPRIIAVNNALKWQEDVIQYGLPATIEHAKSTVSEEQLQVAYAGIVWQIYGPMLLSLVVFFFWTLDHRTKRRDTE